MNQALQNSLREIANNLANFFGTTTETIMSNFPNFLARYGWYTTIKGIPFYTFLAFLCGILFALVSSLMYSIFNISNDLSKPVFIKVFIFVTILSFIFLVIIKIIMCLIAPEIVGAEALIITFK